MSKTVRDRLMTSVVSQVSVSYDAVAGNHWQSPHVFSLVQGSVSDRLVLEANTIHRASRDMSLIITLQCALGSLTDQFSLSS